MKLYFIKGDSQENWGAMALTLKPGAAPGDVIKWTENGGEWKNTSKQNFDSWCKKNKEVKPAADGSK